MGGMQLLVGTDRTLPATKTICEWKGTSTAYRRTLSTFHPLHFYCVLAHSHSHGPLDFPAPSGCSSLSPALPVSRPSWRSAPPPSIHSSLLFLSDAPLMANAERWQMDLTSRWFCLSSLITQIQSAVTWGLRLVKEAQSRDKCIQRTIDFDAENLWGGKRLHLKRCLSTLRGALI